VVSNGGVVQNPQKDHALGVTPGLESHKYSQASGPYWLAEAIKVSQHLLFFSILISAFHYTGMI
jgi:hypothetical protein